MIYITFLALISSGVMFLAWWKSDDVWAFWVTNLFVMSMLLTTFTTIRAMMIDSVKAQDFSLANSQSGLISGVSVWCFEVFMGNCTNATSK